MKCRPLFVCLAAILIALLAPGLARAQCPDGQCPRPTATRPAYVPAQSTVLVVSAQPPAGFGPRRSLFPRRLRGCR